MNHAEIREKLGNSFTTNAHWYYKIVCCDPLVMAAYPTSPTNRRNEVVPFHICDLEGLLMQPIENLARKVTAEFDGYNRCKNCGTEYKLASVLKAVTKVKL